MPEFTFQGRNQAGASVAGKRSANSIDAVAAQLFSEGITPIEIIPATHTVSLKKILFLGQKITSDEIAMFCRQMYTLYKAGIPVASAVLRLAETTRNHALANALHSIADSLASGQNMGSAMQAHPKIFPSLIVKLVQVGEASAQLDEAFAAAAEYLDLESSTTRRIKTVLRYPTFVVLAITTAIVVLNIFVIPVFAKLYARFHAQLPLPTRILLGISSFMHDYWYLLLGAVLIIIFLARSYLNTINGKLAWGKWQLKIPLIGNIIMLIILARFAKTFAIIIRTGVPLPEGIALVAGTANNLYASQGMLSMRTAIEHGETLTNAAANTKLFSPLVLQMLAVGEETGSLETMLTEVSGFYEREAEYNIKKLADRIEPVLLVMIAGMVLLLALGVFLPMWDMIKFVH